MSGPSIKTSDGRVWLGTNGGGWIGLGGGGLTEFDGGAFRSYTPSDGLTDDMIIDLTEDRDGNLWVGTATQRGNENRDTRIHGL